MGLMRKLASVSTAGAIDFRSDKERTARNTKKVLQETRKQTELLSRPARVAPSAPVIAVASEDRVAKIERLVALRDQGALTPEEFEAEKHKILAAN